MVIIATHDSSFAIEPDWYLKGLNYEQTAQQQRENSRLGLVGQARRRPAADRHEPAERDLHVFDRAGKPVKNATVDLVAFAHLRASNRASSVLLPHEGGEYEATLAFEDPGMWEFRLVVTRARRRLRTL